jgi:hypothetical protein
MAGSSPIPCEGVEEGTLKRPGDNRQPPAEKKEKKIKSSAKEQFRADPSFSQAPTFPLKETMFPIPLLPRHLRLPGRGAHARQRHKGRPLVPQQGPVDVAEKGVSFHVLGAVGKAQAARRVAH